VAELSVVEENEQFQHIALTGRLDAEGVRDVSRNFQGQIDGNPKPTLVDLSRLEFLASAGMAMLLTGAKTLRQSGAKMVLFKPQSLIAQILTYAGLNDVIPVAHEKEQALQLLLGK